MLNAVLRLWIGSLSVDKLRDRHLAEGEPGASRFLRVDQYPSKEERSIISRELVDCQAEVLEI